MTKILENAILIAAFILLLVAIVLSILTCTREYAKAYASRSIYKCEISFSESMVTMPCEYVDGVVKIRI